MTDDDKTRLSARAADRTRPSQRRRAEADDRPADVDGDATLPATRAPGGTTGADARPADGAPGALAPPPPGVDARPAHRGEFGDAPHHYYPRSRRTHEAVSTGAWPESRGAVEELFTPAEHARVLSPEARAARDERLRRRRTGRIVAIVAGGAATVGAAVAALVVLL